MLKSLFFVLNIKTSILKRPNQKHIKNIDFTHTTNDKNMENNYVNTFSHRLWSSKVRFSSHKYSIMLRFVSVRVKFSSPQSVIKWSKVLRNCQMIEVIDGIETCFISHLLTDSDPTDDISRDTASPWPDTTNLSLFISLFHPLQPQ